MSYRPLVLALFTLLGTAACGAETTGPSPALCRVQSGAEVCVDRSEYRPTDFVRITVRNVGSVSIFKDGCATKLVGKTSRAADFEASFDPQLRCGAGATAADVIANSVEILPGATFEESLQLVSFAFQGFYRVNVWIVDSNGELASALPAISPTFDVFPSAGAS